MMDFFMHAANVRYVSEWGPSDSPYSGLFERPDLLAANTLFYSLGGALARVFNPLSVARFLIGAMYIVGYPLVMLYALRAFGRSAWGAILANALVFERFFVSGFAAELIGYPLALLAITLFYRLLRRTTPGRVAFLAVLLSLVFLAHAFIFFWMGAVLASMSIAAVPFELRAGLRSLARTAGGVALAVAPALALCARWVLKSGERYGVAKAEPTQMTFLPAPEAFRRIADLVTFGKTPHEQMLLAWLLLLIGVALALGRLERNRQPPVLEMVCAATFFSYFILPEQVRNETVVNMRQLGHALWLTPVLVSPVSARASRLARYVVICGILVYSYARTSLWHQTLVGFASEARGMEQVLAQAPPGKRLDFPNLGMESSFIYDKMAFWHAEAYYVACCGGVIWDVPGAADPYWWLRFRPGRRPIPDRALGQDWSLSPKVWDYYDLVLVHAWRPSPVALRAAERDASLIAASGDWQLWGKRP